VESDEEERGEPSRPARRRWKAESA
jgi:hypothetical protein